MRRSSLEKVLLALNASGARYLVVGGLAVVAHGYVRLTQDLDLDLGSKSLIDILQALKGLGYHPLVPVDILEFADPAARADWIENKNMQVFNLVSDEIPDLVVDLFVKDPFDFAVEFERAGLKEILPTIGAPVVDVEALIRMKTEAGRDQDRIDIAKLREIYATRD